MLKGERPEWVSEKLPRRLAIATTHRIVLNVGDDFGDFLPDVRRQKVPEREQARCAHRDRWGRQWFMIPNPMYGSWLVALGPDLEAALAAAPAGDRELRRALNRRRSTVTDVKIRGEMAAGRAAVVYVDWHDAGRRPRAPAPAEVAEEPRSACALCRPAGGPVLARAALAESPAPDQVGRRPRAPAPRRPAEHREDAPRGRRSVAVRSARTDVVPDQPRRLAARRTLRADRRTRARAPARAGAKKAEVDRRDLDVDRDQAATGAAERPRPPARRRRHRRQRSRRSRSTTRPSPRSSRTPRAC